MLPDVLMASASLGASSNPAALKLSLCPSERPSSSDALASLHMQRARFQTIACKQLILKQMGMTSYIASYIAAAAKDIEQQIDYQ